MSLDLKKLEQEFDDALAKETPETLNNWLTNLRTKTMTTTYFTLEEVKALLKKQRELCSHALECDISKSEIHNLILHAPEPNLIPTPPSLIKFI